MPSPNQFFGLTMPVFSAFGWAGEETAINYALSQLEIFVKLLFGDLPKEAQTQFPVHGLDRGSQSVYLAVSDTPETGPYIGFYARPMSFELSLTITDKATLTKAYRAASRQASLFYDLLEKLGPDWNLRLQQMEYDEETGIATHYQDLFKGSLKDLDEETAVTVLERAAFLNGESSWVVPIYVSHRLPAERASAMGRALIGVMSEQVTALFPLVRLLTGKTRKSKAKSAQAPKPAPEPRVVVESTTIRRPSEAADLESFTYVSELKALHIRRGFINLTPNHWPFFAESARSETRPVTVKYASHSDHKSAVWHLASNNQARLVLSSAVHEWLEDHFVANDQIQVIADKQADESIVVKLAPIE